MIKRLFFYGINAIAAGPAVSRKHHSTVLIGAHETEAALARVHLAEARADVALHPSVGQLMPVLGPDC